MQRQPELRSLLPSTRLISQSANVDRVKQELAEYELIPEDWGGKHHLCTGIRTYQGRH